MGKDRRSEFRMLELDGISVGGPDEEETLPGAEWGRTQNVSHSVSMPTSHRHYFSLKPASASIRSFLYPEG